LAALAALLLCLIKRRKNQDDDGEGMGYETESTFREVNEGDIDQIGENTGDLDLFDCVADSAFEGVSMIQPLEGTEDADLLMPDYDEIF
jgi:hypothetical protein